LELRLECALTCNVAHDAGEEALAIEHELADGQLERERGAITAQSDELAPPADNARLTDAGVAFEVLDAVRAVRLGHECGERRADHVGRLVAEHAFRSGIERADDAVLIDTDDAVDRAVEDGLQQHVGTVALSEIAHDLREA